MVFGATGRRVIPVVVMGLLVSAAGWVSGQVQTSQDEAGRVVTAYTAPSVRTKYSFRTAGIVREVPVNDGDHVKDGQVLIQQDDRVERKQWESLDLQAKSNAQVEAAEAELKIAELELKRLTGMALKAVAAES